MKKWKRSILFWLLVLIFLIIAPAIVLNARGYRFDIQRGVFVYSGTVTFKSNPRNNIEVRLNDKVFESKKLNRINNSYNLSGLIPRTYNLQVSAPDFQTWHKKISVHSGLATEFWNILLVRNEYERTDIGTLGIEDFFTSSGGRYIAYITTKETGLTVHILDVESQKMETVFSLNGWNFIETDKKENLEWSPDGNFISVPVQRKTNDPKNAGNLAKGLTAKEEIEYDYFILDLKAQAHFTLKQFFGSQEEISSVRWDPKKKNHLFFLKDEALFRADMKNAKNISRVTENISAFDLSEGKIYYVSADNKLIFRNDLEGKDQAEQITNSFPGQENLSISNLIVYDKTRIGLLSQNEEAFIYNHGEHGIYYKKLGEGIRELHFSDDGKKMLFWNNFEIMVYFLRDEPTQPSREENSLQEITRYSEPLSNVQWFKDYEHIIFTSDRWTKIIELDPRDHRNCMDLINTQNDGYPVVYSSYLEKLFFVDVKENSTSLYSIIFPEEISLLGAVGL